MGHLLAVVLPLALGAAVSPTLLALQVVVLSGRVRPLGRAWAVAAGSGFVLAVVTAVGLAVSHAAASRHGGHPRSVAVVDLVAAALLVGLAVRSSLRRPMPADRHQSRTAARLAGASTPWFLAAGAVAMLLNFSTLVLYLPALHEIDVAPAGIGAKAAAVLLLFVITMAAVLVPVVVVSALGKRAAPLLERSNRFMTAHGRQIGIGIELVFGVYLLVKGIVGLS